MKMIVRISLLTLVMSAAFGGNIFSKTLTPAITPSAVPGGGGPMPTCNPFSNPNCQLIR
jgi:hypothetical protein